MYMRDGDCFTLTCLLEGFLFAIAVVLAAGARRCHQAAHISVELA